MDTPETEELATARHETNVAEATIARVRKLCDEPFYTGSPKYWLAVSDVRAALGVSDVR